MSGPRHAEDDRPILDPPQRVSGMRVPAADEWSLPGKPDGLELAADDAWRQTGFVLDQNLRLIEIGQRLQLRMVAAGYGPAARTMKMAAYASFWSRAFSCLTDATALTRRGSYQSALPLIRQAIEHIAAGAQLETAFEDFKAWSHRAYTRHPGIRGEEIGLGHYFAGEAIARDDDLRGMYRAASDLGRPNFGPTALFVANEASHERFPLIFADSAFHIGWAQLLLGWVLRCDSKQLHVAMHLREQFPATQEVREAVVSHVAAVEALLADSARCNVEEYVDEDDRRRLLLVNFRRQPGDAAKRVLL